MKPRAAPVTSKVTIKICCTLIYCICVIVIFWNERLFITYAHTTFDKFYFSVTNLGPRPLTYVTFSTYKLAIAKYYLRDLCCPVSGLAARRVLRSAARGEVLVPRARLAIMQRRAFLVVGPSAWNDLPFELGSLLMAHPYNTIQ